MEAIKFSKADIEEISKYRDIIEMLIKNKACSTITLKFREMVKVMDSKLGYSNTCQTCNSALMASVSRIYAEFLKDKAYYEKEKITDNVKTDTKNGKGKNRKK